MLAPEDAWALAWRAKVSKQLGRIPSAIEDLRQAVHLQADYHWAWLMLGEAFLSAGNLSEASHALERAITLKPTDWWAWSMKGAACFAKNDLYGALDALDRSLSLNPDSKGANLLKLNILNAISGNTSLHSAHPLHIFPEPETRTNRKPGRD